MIFIYYCASYFRCSAVVLPYAATCGTHPVIGNFHPLHKSSVSNPPPQQKLFRFRQSIASPIQFFMKLELINYCHTNLKNLEKEFRKYFKATEDYTTIYKLLRVMKCKLFGFRTVVSNYYDVFFTNRYHTMLYRETEIHLSDIPEFVVFLIKRFCDTLMPILTHNFRLLDFIEENYNLEFYSATVLCHFILTDHVFRLSGLILLNLRKALCFNLFKLNKIIILIMFFTAGLPFRMTEVLGLQFNDTKRNIFFRGGKMVCTYTYNKTDNITNSTKLISRGYSIIVSKIVFFYINYVRYYELRLIEQLKQNEKKQREMGEATRKMYQIFIC